MAPSSSERSLTRSTMSSLTLFASCPARLFCSALLGFDLELADDTNDWATRQRAFTAWERISLNVYFTPVQHDKCLALMFLGKSRRERKQC